MTRPIHRRFATLHASNATKWDRLLACHSSNRLIVQQRNAQNTNRVIRGYGAVYYDEKENGSEYWLWDDIVERIKPGAFSKVLDENQDVRALFNHDPNHVLGRTVSGTLRLSSDAVGLYYEADESPNDPTWLSVAEKINRSDVSGSSFGFIPSVTQWETVKEENRTYEIRWIVEMGMVFDVGPVTYPAYESATSSRSISADERIQLLSERNAFYRDRDQSAVEVRLRTIKANEVRVV